MRLLVVLVTLSACNASGPGAPLDGDPVFDGNPRCVIEEVLAGLIGDAVVEDCGTLEIDAGDAALTAAHDCVVAHASAGTPFRVQWAIQGIDSRVARAAAGVDGTLYTLSYDGDPSGGGGDDNPSTWTSTCSSFEDLGACPDLAYSLCIACTGQGTAEHCE